MLCVIYSFLPNVICPLREHLAETVRTDMYQLKVDEEKEEHTDSDVARLRQVRIMKKGPQTFRS